MIKGIAASDGIAIGKVLLLKKEEPVIIKTAIDDSQIQANKDLLDAALEASKDQLKLIQSSAGETMAEILDAHIMILEDTELIDAIVMKIETEKQDAISATDETISFFADLFKNMDNEYMKERAADMLDIGYRVVMNMLGKEIPSLLSINEPVVIVSHDITPSDTAQMKKDMVLGFLTNIGGRTSHSAIMARSLEIPAILGLGDITSKVNAGDTVCFDGEEGLVFINPDEAILSEYAEKAMSLAKEKELLTVLKNEKSVTIDGHHIEIAANIGGPEDAKKADGYGAEGVGLYRTEFLYMDREALPTEEEQFEAYKAVLQTMGERPVVIRTLDIGGDKKLPYLPLPEEMNPFLGYRAVRICLDQPEIFKVQLRALLRAGVYGNLRIMYPMISCVEEVRAANAILGECKAELESEGTAYAQNFQVGIMVEIPAAAVAADLIADEVDFFSIGTNDLIQYTCAVDRMNEKISHLYNPFNPAVLRLIKNVIDAAHENNIWCGMCGETAGDKRLIPIYLGMGLDEFSMSASSMLKARKQVSELSYSQMKEMAEAALKIKTSDAIEKFVAEKAGL
ncbi:MAG: phosphoenolpyruvate--protein phosphotransferase [Proteocatella sp.]